MDLTLVYRDSLPSCQLDDQKSEAKHKIRLWFSQQLANVWDAEPILREIRGEQKFVPARLDNRQIVPDHSHLTESRAHATVEAFGYQILPLVTRFGGLGVHLSIDVLQRGPNATVVIQSNDLDNRLKVLFDALRMPQSTKEVPGHMYGSGGEWLYCLLEDDSLISRVQIEARRLDTPLQSNEPVDYAEVMVKASIKVVHPKRATTGF